MKIKKYSATSIQAIQAFIKITNIYIVFNINNIILNQKL